MSTSAVKCSEGLSNRVSNINKRGIDRMKFAAYMAFSFLTFSCFASNFYHHIYCFMFCTLLFMFVSYVLFSLIFMYCSLYVCSILYFMFHRANRHPSATVN